MKHLLTLLITFAALIAAARTTAQTEVTDNHRLSASNHTVYPITDDALAPTLTQPPAGYEPFFINHYGRHGSRWLSNKETYERPVEQLKKARRDGKLTPQGEQLLQVLEQVQNASLLRTGDLTDIGAEQHQAIARRMLKNFPAVFRGNARIDARATVVLRCILSMQNETMTLRAANPRMNITTDASYHDMHYTSYGYGPDTLFTPIRKATTHITDSLYHTLIKPQRFISMLVNDTAYANHEMHPYRLMRDVFQIVGSLQNHHRFEHINLFKLFTNEEIFTLWRLRNIYWYVRWANAEANGNRMPFATRELLRNIIYTADTTINANTRGAALRFGHDTIILPLACLMGIDSIGYNTADLDNLHLHWQDYRIIPMAANMQMIFYRPTTGTGDILVKVLYNEHEATLPVHTDNPPYYRWSDLRQFYLNKLDTPINLNP